VCYGAGLIKVWVPPMDTAPHHYTLSKLDKAFTPATRYVKRLDDVDDDGMS
jgi:hypothetical protein